MNGKGRPEKLTDELKLRISTLLKDHKKRMKAPAIQNTLRAYLQEVVRKEGNWTDKQISAEAEYRLPGISSIQQYAKTVYAELEKPSPLDKHWHLGVLKDNPFIPADAIPYILKIQKIQNSKPELLGKLTIRQAIWVSRLYTTVKNIRSLGKISYYYSLGEQIHVLSGTTFDTSFYDDKLIEFSKGRDVKLNPFFIMKNIKNYRQAKSDREKDGEK